MSLWWPRAFPPGAGWSEARRSEAKRLEDRVALLTQRVAEARRRSIAVPDEPPDLARSRQALQRLAEEYRTLVERPQIIAARLRAAAAWLLALGVAAYGWERLVPRTR